MKKATCYYLLISILICLPFASGAQIVPTNEADRPKIGLVLSGGGARGAAHVGVLKVLEENQIPIDYIAGTSFGAIVGGLYASGYTAEELEAILASIDWEETLSSDAIRTKKSFRRKKDDIGFQIKFKVGFEDGELKLPSSLITPNNLRLTLAELVNARTDVQNFDHLAVPFRAVATDLENGDEVVLKDGNLASAMVASMTVPALFPPVELNGKLLVDGGTANNIPVNVARDMGAEILIVVDISEPLLKKDQIESFADVIDQLSMLQSNKISEAQIASLSDQDVFLRPDLSDIGFIDFENSMSAIPKGEQAASDAIEKLQLLTLNDSEWRQYAAKKSGEDIQIRISNINIQNETNIHDDVIRSQISVRKGEMLDRKTLIANLNTIYGLELFEDVNYTVRKNGDQNTLDIITKRKENGEDYFRFGLALQESFEGDNAFQLSASYNNLALNSYGGEWLSRINIGERLGAFTEFYQPVDLKQNYYVFANTGAQRFKRNINDDVDSRLIVEQRRLFAATTEIGAGRNFGNWGTVRVGLARTFSNERDRSTFPNLLLSKFDRTMLNAAFIVDTLDNIRFPTSGTALNIRYSNNLNFMGGDDTVDKIEVDGFQPVSFGPNTLGLRYQFATSFNGVARPIDLFPLGSFMRLSAYAPGQITGYHGGSAAIVYYRKVSGGVQPFGDTPIYVGGSFEAGNAWNISDDMSFDDLRWSSSVFIGADTLIGPVYLGGGFGEEGQASAFLYVGQIF